MFKNTRQVSGHGFHRLLKKPFAALARASQAAEKTFSRTCFVSGHAFTRAVSAFNGLGLQPLKLKMNNKTFPQPSSAVPERSEQCGKWT